VVLVEYIFMTRILAQVESKSLRMVDTIDVFSQKESNVMAYGISDAGVSPEVESQMVGRADVVIAIHPSDAAALEEMTHGREVIVTGVDADVRPERRWPSGFVALLPGSGNPLNQAGLRDFLRFAWPRVKTLVPDATLRVAGGVGRVVPPGTAGVTVLGHVPDLAAEYESARVVINPAVAGTGLKIKTVEALAHLTPVVGWAHNRDGLSERLSAYVDEVQDWQEFADAVAKRLLASQSPIDAEGIRAITGELSADAIYRALDERVDRFFAGRASS
jgi:Glycosyl transferases group 1